MENTKIYEVGDRVIVCGKTPGTVVDVFEYMGKQSYSVRFDDRPYSRVPPQTAVSVIPEHLAPEPKSADPEDEAICECRACKPCEGEGGGKRYCEGACGPWTYCNGHEWTCSSCGGTGTDKSGCEIHANTIEPVMAGLNVVTDGKDLPF